MLSVSLNKTFLSLSLFSVKAAITKPEPDDIAVVMYTSGSTGLPKGNNHFVITSLALHHIVHCFACLDGQLMNNLSNGQS